ncbi:hypothetical protein C8F01DRAFT_1345446 [Mycena amicta]|nr:hypothetical protein C8F01DRAFT_1345446 [Mycena amicta]
MIILPEAQVNRTEAVQMVGSLRFPSYAIRAYSQDHPARASSSSSLKDTPGPQVSESKSPPSDIKPTNHLSLHRRYGHISGVKFVIDPRLRVPLQMQMLAPLEEGETEETRRNLSLCTEDGGIDVDVWVLGDDDDEEEDKNLKIRGRVRIWASARNGRVSLRLVCFNFFSPVFSFCSWTLTQIQWQHCSPHTSRPCPPLSLSLHTTDGSISLTLPRTFRGPLTVRLARGYARMRFSPAVSKATTVFSESSDGVRRCFVGDFAGWDSEEEGKWTGDEATLSSDTGTFGSVWIEYEDEREARQWWWWYKRARENGPWMGASVLGVILVGVLFAR